MKVVDLPWSQLDEWKVLLAPIYAAVGITNPEKQVVRSLLASMPPSMSIPVHHDTGFWVKHTHRCHVPVVTNELVDFMVGPSPERMQKINFKEGHLVELNNQAKHSVTNGNSKESNFWRVHLIFDYVDLPGESCPEAPGADADAGTHLPPAPPVGPPVFTRTLLKSGDVLNQTRRSIAVAGADDRPAGPLLPRFIVLGAQKCGTTSMYEYIMQHPLVLKGQRRESHYFDWRYRAELDSAADSVEKHREHYMNTFFYPKHLVVHTSLITGDSTPSYLLHSDVVIPRLLRMYGGSVAGNGKTALEAPLRLLVMLRDPVDRAYSQFQMMRDQRGSAEQIRNRGKSSLASLNFADVVDAELAALEAAGLTADSSLEHFHSKLLAPISGVQHGGHSLLLRGVYYFQLMSWMQYFPLYTGGAEVEGSLAVPTRAEIMVTTLDEISIDKNAAPTREGAARIQTKMNAVFAFLGLREHLLEDVSVKNKRDYTPEVAQPGGEAKPASVKMQPEVNFYCYVCVLTVGGWVRACVRLVSNDIN
jgi:hypothetical protein